MDGPRLHRIAVVGEVLAGFGATIRYLPAHSPEFHPIEMARSWLRRRMHKAASRKIRTLHEVIERDWIDLTPDLCAARVRHDGYGATST
jgi:transposase